MTTVFLSPLYGAGQQLLNNSGVPLANGKINIYLAGTTTRTSTYTTNTGSVANANPIILDSGGRVPTQIWLPAGASYKFVVTDDNDNPVGYTQDSITGINDATFPYNVTQEWVTGSTPTYIDATHLSIVGDQTATYTPGRRLRTINTSGLVYSTVITSTFTAGVTTLYIYNDSTTLDAGLNNLAYGFLNATPNSIPGTTATMNFASAVNNNIGLGNGAIGSLVTGADNVAIGRLTYHAATSGQLNVAIGVSSMQVGVVTGQSNIGIGSNTLYNLTGGNFNVAVGLSAMLANTTGSYNVAIGDGALAVNVGADMHVAIGAFALQTALAATPNIAIGAYAGYNGAANPLSGGNNIYIGYTTKNLTTLDTNSITIGNAATSKGSNTVYIGNASITDTYLTGRINIPQYTTAGAPSYVKGALYFDTTLNKLRVGGASAWETITSV